MSKIFAETEWAVGVPPRLGEEDYSYFLFPEQVLFLFLIVKFARGKDGSNLPVSPHLVPITAILLANPASYTPPCHVLSLVIYLSSAWCEGLG